MSNMVMQYVTSAEEIKRIRVIWIDPSYTYAYIINLKEPASLPFTINISELELEMESKKWVEILDPYAKVLNENEIPVHLIEERNQAWEVIQFLWRGDYPDILKKNYRRECIRKTAEKFDMSIYKVERLMKRFWQRGMTKNSILLDYSNSGAKGKERGVSERKRGRPRRVGYDGEVIEGINIDENIKKIFSLSIDMFYRKKERISLRETYHYMLQKFFSDHYQVGEIVKIKIWDQSRIPTYQQFYYWYKKEEDVTKDFITRNSEKQFASEERELLGSSTMEVFGPGSRYQIDATVADVYLLSSLNRSKVIGRPVVYAVMDVYSRMVTGIYVGMEGPSWIGAMMALDNAVSDKQEFCQKYNIQISENEWPCTYLPECILADRGEFEGYQVENLINNLNVKVENTPPYRGDLKGIVERVFRTVNEKIKHTTPGAIQKEFRERGDRDYRLDATLNLEEFTQIIIQLVLHHNKRVMSKYPLERGMLSDEVKPSPISIWNWGIKNRKGRFNKLPRDIVRLNLLPRAKANLSRSGIKFRNMFFSSERAIEEQWFISSQTNSVDFVYDPRNMNYIYIPEENGRSFIKCFLLEKSYMYRDLTLEEIVFQDELQVEIRNEAVDEKNQIQAEMDIAINTIIKSAKEKTKNESTLESARSKLKNIKANRLEEKEQNRISESFELAKKDPIEGELIPIPRETPAKKERVTSSTSMLERLKKKRDEKLGRN
jgi:hypothetical protein